MGACCSSPAAADPLSRVDIRAASAESPRHHEDSVNDIVHVLATVHASTHQTSGQHRQHHHNHQHHSVLTSTAAHSRARGPKQQQHLLRAVSPPQQPQQQHAVSPRSYHQLHQLLPAAPLQHLAQGHNRPSSLLSEHSKHSHILHSSGSGSGGGIRSVLAGFHSDAADSTTAGSADQARSMATPLQQRMHSAGSGNSGSSITPADALSPVQLLAVCAAVLQEEPAFQAAGITPLLLASLCLIESGGCPHAKQHREHLSDTAHGLCQVLLSTAQWLAGSQGFDRHGTQPTVKDLEHPKTCAYFAAAYLTILSRYGGSARSESFVARAYHAGPKGVDTAAAHSYLQKYLKAKHCLTQVAKAMSVTAAAAALAAQVRLPAAAAGAGSCPAAAAGMVAQLAAKQASPPPAAVALSPRDQSREDQDSTCLRDTTGTTAAAPAGSSVDSHSSSSSADICAGRQVLVRRTTADLVLALCSDWQDVDQATGKAQAAAAGAGLGAGSILAHMLPSRWALASNKQHGQQADSRGEGALALVPISAVDLCTAWQRILTISADVAHTALAHATAAAALAPKPDPNYRIRTTDAGAAGGTAAAAEPAGSSRRGSSDSSSAAGSRVAGSAGRQGSAAAQAAQLPGQAVDSMPCVMHVVGHGESLQRIASVCSLGVSDLLAANPDVKDADAVHHNDCIAVPLPAVLPRLYVVQPGDTLHSIARAHEVSVGRVLAKNPELTDPGRLQPGWVVALPGLKGDSQVALPVDWLSEASLTADMPQQQAAWQLQSAAGADADAELTVTLAVQQQQQAVGVLGRVRQQAHLGSGRQQLLIGTVSEPGQGDAPRQQGGLPAAVSDPGPGVMGRGGQPQLQETELLPAVGSGAFLFTVGSSSSLGDSHSSIPAVHGSRSGRGALHKLQQPQQQRAASQRAGGKKTRTRMAQQQ